MKEPHIISPGLLDDSKHYEIFRKYPDCSSEEEMCLRPRKEVTCKLVKGRCASEQQEYIKK